MLFLTLKTRAVRNERTANVAGARTAIKEHLAADVSIQQVCLVHIVVIAITAIPTTSRPATVDGLAISASRIVGAQRANGLAILAKVRGVMIAMRHGLAFLVTRSSVQTYRKQTAERIVGDEILQILRI